jgi:hypothetical protein
VRWGRRCYFRLLESEIDLGNIRNLKSEIDLENNRDSKSEIDLEIVVSRTKQMEKKNNFFSRNIGPTLFLSD